MVFRRIQKKLDERIRFFDNKNREQENIIETIKAHLNEDARFSNLLKNIDFEYDPKDKKITIFTKNKIIANEIRFKSQEIENIIKKSKIPLNKIQIS